MRWFQLLYRKTTFIGKPIGQQQPHDNILVTCTAFHKPFRVHLFSALGRIPHFIPSTCIDWPIVQLLQWDFSYMKCCVLFNHLSDFSSLIVFVFLLRQSAFPFVMHARVHMRRNEKWKKKPSNWDVTFTFHCTSIIYLITLKPESECFTKHYHSASVENDSVNKKSRASKWVMFCCWRWF